MFIFVLLIFSLVHLLFWIMPWTLNRDLRLTPVVFVTLISILPLVNIIVLLWIMWEYAEYSHDKGDNSKILIKKSRG